MTPASLYIYIYRVYAADDAGGNNVANTIALRSKTSATISAGLSDLHGKKSKDWSLSSGPFTENPLQENPFKETTFTEGLFKKDQLKERRQSDSTTTTTAAAAKMLPGLSRSMTWVRPKDHPSRVLKSIRSEWQPRWPEHARRALESIPPSTFEGVEGHAGSSGGEGDPMAAGGEPSERSKVVNRCVCPGNGLGLRTRATIEFSPLIFSPEVSSI